MRPRFVIVLGQNLLEVPFVQNDYMIQTVAADGIDEALNIRILPGRLVRRYDVVDA